MNIPNKLVRKFVLTGGPCAGKSTCLVAIREHFEKLGWHVVIVSETATELLGAGLGPSHHYSNVEFQRALLGLQIAKENEVYHFGRLSTHQKVLVVFDRGVLDGAAYCSPEDWAWAISEVGLKDVRNLYDGVIHLRTVADGKPDLYLRLYRQNPVRIEDTPEKALEQDRATEQVWLEHSPIFIGNDGDMKKKADDVIAAISHKLGIPVPIEVEKKFLVDKPQGGIQEALTSKRIHFVVKNIVQYYLPQSTLGNETRIRRVSVYSDNPYFVITTKRGFGVAREEREEYISRETFETLLQVYPNMLSISKRRTCFVWSNQLFEVDEIDPRYGGVFKDCYLCEVELISADTSVSFPNWMRPVDDVSGDKDWSNFSMAK